MHAQTICLGLGVALATAAMAQGQSPDEWLVEAMAPKAESNWKYVLPQDTWQALTSQIPIAHEGGTGFQVQEEGPMKLAVDTNGDGKPDDDVKGLAGYVRLRGKLPSGEPLLYGVRIRRNGNAWQYAVSGAMVGKARGEVVKLIDADGDGRYDGIGKDAIIVGTGVAACYLSKVVNLGGELYRLEVAADGTSLKTAPYTGEAGYLDVRSGFESNGKLVSAVVGDESGQLSFNLAECGKTLKVPAANYKLVGGMAAKAGETARVRAGKMQPLVVKNNETAELKWGSPVVADFSFTHQDTTITIRPDVKFYGRAGEEYYELMPDAKSPKFVVVDKQNGKVLETGRLPGC